MHVHASLRCTVAAHRGPVPAITRCGGDADVRAQAALGGARSRLPTVARHLH